MSVFLSAFFSIKSDTPLFPRVYWVFKAFYHRRFFWGVFLGSGGLRRARMIKNLFFFNFLQAEGARTSVFVKFALDENDLKTVFPRINRLLSRFSMYALPIERPKNRFSIRTIEKTRLKNRGFFQKFGFFIKSCTKNVPYKGFLYD
jgi:hypothetical protein